MGKFVSLHRLVLKPCAEMSWNTLDEKETESKAWSPLGSPERPTHSARFGNAVSLWNYDGRRPTTLRALVLSRTCIEQSTWCVAILNMTQCSPHSADAFCRCIRLPLQDRGLLQSLVDLHAITINTSSYNLLFFIIFWSHLIYLAHWLNTPADT